MRSLPLWSVLMLSIAAGSAMAADPLSGWTLKGDDVVFMYAAGDPAAYTAYGATVVAWGGANTMALVRQMHDLGIHATGKVGCASAGPQALHDNPNLAEAVCRDIEGKPIAVPWMSRMFQGTRTPCLWGCTNHPAYRAWLRQNVAQVMSGGADGLHVDDYMGTAHPAMTYGGCFCDYCMADFRQWLIAHSTPRLLAAAKVRSFDQFDYRDLVRQYAKTRGEYLKVQNTIPLHKEFVDCQIQLAVEHVQELGRTAAEVVNHPITLSANNVLPKPANLAIAPYLSYMVSEVEHHADKGAGGLAGAVEAYRMAEALDKPMASTAAGWDWAYIKEHKAENLVKIWIALSYACGQHLMTPDKTYCYTPGIGSSNYNGPREVYAPMYQFVRHNPQLFVGLKAAGPLAIPAGLPTDLSTTNARAAFVTALNFGNPQPPMIAGHVWAFPRAGQTLSVVHLVNLDYDAAKDAIAVKHDLPVKVPAEWFGKRFTEATVYRPDAEPAKVRVGVAGGQFTVSVPELRQWAIICLK